MSQLEADVEALKAKFKALEAKGAADVSWVKTNWPHFVTWVGVAAAVVKHFL